MIPRFTVVQVAAASAGKPTVLAWSPAAYEEPGLATAHKILGVTMTAANDEEPVAVMRRGYMRDVDDNGESWAVGDILWAASGGAVTKTRPAAPLPLVLVGSVFETFETGVCSIDVDVRVLPSLSELTGVKVETPVDKDVLIYKASTHVWEPRQLDHGADLAGLTDDDHPQYKFKSGFARDAAGAHLVTMSYDKTTKKVTITPTGSSFDVWVNGVKFTKTGAQVTPAHSAATGKHFFYYDDAGVLQVSDLTAWSIRNRLTAPVAIVYWSVTKTDGLGFFEAHGHERNLELHYLLHFTQGTRLISGGALSGYTLATGSDAGVTYAIATARIADEDISLDVSDLADGGPYTVFYRTGASGEWTWDTTPVLPFLGTSYPAWNNANGGGAGVWGMTDLVGTGGGNWTNYYLCAVPSISPAIGFVLIPSQASYASIALASGESLASLALGELPFEEIAPLYRITLHGRSTYGGTKQAAIVQVTSIATMGVSITGSGVSPSIHNSLSGRTAADAHPASSITFAPYSTIAATDVQSAIQELVDEGGGGGATTLDDLTDVDTTGVADTNVLAFETSSGLWKPVAAGTPAAHASTHRSGGADSIKLDDLAAPDDNTDLDASTSKHGLLPKLGGGTTNFLRADGTWAAPAGGGGSLPHPEAAPASPNTEDDEFTATSLNAKWTETSTAAAVSYGTTIPSCIAINFSGDQAYSIRQAYAPGAGVAFTITEKLHLFPVANYHQGGFELFDSDESDSVRLDFAYVAGQWRFSLSTKDAGAYTYQRLYWFTPVQTTLFLQVRRSTADVWELWCSLDGRAWGSAGSYTKAFTVDHLTLFMTQGGQTVPCRVAIDWVRRDWAG